MEGGEKYLFILLMLLGAINCEGYSIAICEVGLHVLQRHLATAYNSQWEATFKRKTNRRWSCTYRSRVLSAFPFYSLSLFIRLALELYILDQIKITFGRAVFIFCYCACLQVLQVG